MACRTHRESTIADNSEFSSARPQISFRTNSDGDIYWRALDGSGLPLWLSRSTCRLLAGAFPAPPCQVGTRYSCFNHALSGDGRHVVYQANAGPGSSTVLIYVSVSSTNAL